MVEAKINRDNGILTFLCPKCKNQDVVYLNMQNKCYRCKFKYNFALNAMEVSILHRISYYFNNKSMVKT